MADCVPAGFHLMTPLNSDATWSSVHGSVTGFGGAGNAGVAGVWAGVSTSMASSSLGVAPAWLARPPFFLGGMLDLAAVDVLLVLVLFYMRQINGKLRSSLSLSALRGNSSQNE